MSEPSRNRAHLWRGPLLAWAVLIVLAAINLGSAYLPLGAGNLALNLLLAAVMAMVLAIFLMDLRNAKTLVRIVAVTGLFWMIFLFALTFSDYLSRRQVKLANEQQRKEVIALADIAFWPPFVANLPDQSANLPVLGNIFPVSCSR